MEAGTHPVTVGFSTVWLSLTTRVPRVLAQTAVYCRMYEMPLHGSFIPCCFLVHPVQLVFYLHDYLFANKLILKSILCSIIFNTQLNSFSKINCLSFYFLDPLCLFTRASFISCQWHAANWATVQWVFYQHPIYHVNTSLLISTNSF